MYTFTWLTTLLFFVHAGYRMASEAARSTLEAAVRNNKDDLGTGRSVSRHFLPSDIIDFQIAEALITL